MNEKVKVGVLSSTVLSVSLLTVMAATAVSPALSAISQAFPEASPGMVKMVLTLPSLVVIPVSLLSGVLSSRINKKTLVIIGMVLYLIFGVGGGFARTFTQLVIFRALFGIPIGLILPLSNTLIFDLIEKSKQHKMMGLSGSLSQLGGVFFVAFSGFLAAFSWKYSFGVYAIVLVILLMVVLFLPSMPAPAVSAKSVSRKGQAQLGWKLYAIAFLATMSSVCFFVVNTDLALFINKESNLFSSTVPLMASREEVEQSIAKGEVSESLIQNMALQHIVVRPESAFKEVIPHKQWIIVDGSKIYTISRDLQNQRLNVSASLGTSQMAGYALSLRGIPAIFAGLILAFMMRAFGRFILPFGAFIMALGYILLGFASNIHMVYASMIFIGLAGGLVTSPLMLYVPQAIPPSAMELGISIVSSAALLGQFLSPLVTNGLAQLFGNPTFQFKFFATGGILLTLCIVGLMYIFLMGRQPRETS